MITNNIPQNETHLVKPQDTGNIAGEVNYVSQDIKGTNQPVDTNDMDNIKETISYVSNDSSTASVGIPSAPTTQKHPTFRILEGKVQELNRPLSILRKKAYAATWQKVAVGNSVEPNSDGTNCIDPPEKETVEERLIVLCSDGTVYGMEIPVEYLGFKVHLTEKIKSENNWGGEGVNSYLTRKYPKPIALFDELVQVGNHFIDFHNSLADQKTMCEFVACFILSTWFLDAFNVAGYLWITGERGSGKTNLLMLISRLSYLGEFITASSSFASLRDMADYGATLCCDDAENITDAQKPDSDKMALLLAGNHKGLTVSLKEQEPNKKWRTRHVNAYCPKAFSAIRVPDSTLASRVIIVPMLRTPDATKGNIDPMDDEAWPCDRKRMVDDLWAVALLNLPNFPGIDKWVGENSKLLGRNLQPWRGTLVVAKWLNDLGAEGLSSRMENLAINYQNERAELELVDFNRVIMLAIVKCAMRAISANCANSIPMEVDISVATMITAIKEVVEEEDLDFDLSWLNEKKIGKRLTRLGFRKVPRSGGKGSRSRRVNIEYLSKQAKSYNINFSSQVGALMPSPVLVPRPENGTHGSNGSTDTDNPNSSLIGDGIDVTVKPDKTCHVCGGVDFWQRPDGGWLCKTCHPQPMANVVIPSDSYNQINETDQFRTQISQKGDKNG